MDRGASIARVAVDSPLPRLDRLFDYRVPPSLAADARPGVRVRMPVRSAGRVMDGWIVELAERSEFGGELSELESIVSPVPVLSPAVWALARRAADRAAGVASDILRLAIPKRAARIETAHLAAAPPAREPVTPVAVTGYGNAALEDAVRGGDRLALRGIPAPEAWTTTLAQLASVVLAEGRGAIIAVPDRRDVERVVPVLGRTLGAGRVVRLDAEQAPADRYRSFLRAATEDGLAVVGTRSVVYAPVRRLGLIAMWDEGDPLYQEPLAPGVHARDAALLRQELEGCALVLLAHSPSTDVERLVEVGWCRPVPFAGTAPAVIPTALQLGDDRLAEQARIPSTAWRAASEALRHGPVLVQVARPGEDAPVGSVRTASELGRAFPNARVVVADGERRVLQVGPEPALVIATRGAEPVAEGGYRAVLLLDGDRMLARESLRVAEDALRTWSNAAALAAPGARVFLVGVSGRIAAAMSTWRQPAFIAEELAERRAARFPPAVRTATITGSADAVEAALAALAEIGLAGDDVLPTALIDDATVRAIVRFDYGRGADVARVLRGEILRRSAGRRPTARSRPNAPELRVRMDDLEPFTGEGTLRRGRRIEG